LKTFYAPLGDATLSAYIKNTGEAATVGVYLRGDSDLKPIPTDNIWRRYAWTRPLAEMTGDQLANQAKFWTSGTGIMMACPQLEVKNHATQIVQGTRSATQGLLDLTCHSIIDITHVIV